MPETWVAESDQPLRDLSSENNSTGKKKAMNMELVYLPIILKSRKWYKYPTIR